MKKKINKLELKLRLKRVRVDSIACILVFFINWLISIIGIINKDYNVGFIFLSVSLLFMFLSLGNMILYVMYNIQDSLK